MFFVFLILLFIFIIFIYFFSNISILNNDVQSNSNHYNNLITSVNNIEKNILNKSIEKIIEKEEKEEKEETNQNHDEQVF